VPDGKRSGISLIFSSFSSAKIDADDESSSPTPGNPIMVTTLEWLFDISLAVGSAAATGSVLMLMLELAKVTYKHLMRLRLGARLAGFSANAAS
jgi:hypothetical protein